MENASKALLIAGAILLAILLISLGIMVFNQGQEAVKNSGMSKAEIAAFNGQFTKYEGKRRGSEVRSLIQEINASNAADTAEGNGRSITISGGKVTKNGTDVSYPTSAIKSTVTYTVTIKSYDDSGFVDDIEIK